MSLFRRMRIYTVHIPSGAADAQEKAVFVREGFNWAAFLFHFLWAFYHRLWLSGIAIMGVFVTFGIVEELHIVTRVGLSVLQLGFLVFVGFHANDWLRSQLGRRGYILSDVTAADDLLHAEQRYFERILAAH